MKDTLYYGDNLDVLRGMASESVDLIYLDPPFNSQRTYNLVFKDKASSGQRQAFVDVWTWDDKAERAYREITSPSAQVPAALREAMAFLHRYFGPDRRDDMAYPAMMAIRLLELHRVLKSTGSLYLHCDPTASHHLRLILDAIFGAECFINEIVWKRYGAHGDAKRYGAVHDTLLFYSKTRNVQFHRQFVPYTAEYAESRFRFVDESGRRYQEQNLSSPNPRPNLTYSYKASNGVTYRPHANGWKCELERMQQLDREGRLHFPKSPGGRLRLKMFLDECEGVPLQDVWTDIVLASTSKERIGYPTQKPVELLQRIVRASSRPGDVVLDPFCGCGTVIEACIKEGRTWIGIDIGLEAVDVIRKRLDERCPGAEYLEVGIPADVESAKRLADTNPYAFQWWALDRMAARQVAPARGKKRDRKGGDRGVDGEFIVRDPAAERPGRVIVSVKAGENVGPVMVRELIGTVFSERADAGVLVTMIEPTANMRSAAREAGTVASSLHEHGCPMIQIITVAELFAGKQLALPGRNITHEVTPVSGAQPTLPGIVDVAPAGALTRGRVSRSKTAPAAELPPSVPVAGRPKRARRAALPAPAGAVAGGKKPSRAR